jgi:putative endonuclease
VNFYIYILQSLSNDIYYIGYSSNPWHRLEQHNTSDRATFTAKHRPWKLSAVFLCPGGRSNAVKLERYIKRQKNKSLIQQMTNNETKLTGVLDTLIRVPKTSSE